MRSSNKVEEHGDDVEDGEPIESEEIQKEPLTLAHVPFVAEDKYPTLLAEIQGLPIGNTATV